MACGCAVKSFLFVVVCLPIALSTAAATTSNDVIENLLPDNNIDTEPFMVNTTLAPTTLYTTTPAPQRKKGRGLKRCKCLRRFTKEVSKMIDERLLEFEDKYLLNLNGNRERIRASENEAHAASSRIQSIDKLLLKLNTDVVQTKEALSFMNANLDVIRNEMNHTRGDVRTLNVSFQQLDKAVANLTRFVDKVEKMIPTGLVPPTSSAVSQEDPTETYPRHCDEVFQQGGMQFQGDYYIMIKPDGVLQPFKALCKMLNNSGWTVIQKRLDGSVDFFRSWTEYKNGFGSLEGEFWLGNDYIHHLSAQEPTMLRIEMTDWEERTYTAVYDSFSIDSEKDLFRLHIGDYHGDAGDSLKSHWENHDGMPFSTKDRDNDGRYYDSCAEHFHGAWWFNNCFDSHLNGKYYHKGFHKNYFQRDGIQWNTIHMYSSLKSVQIMLKPSQSVTTAPPPVEESPKRSGGGGGKKEKTGKKRGGRGRRDRSKKE